MMLRCLASALLVFLVSSTPPASQGVPPGNLSNYSPSCVGTAYQDFMNPTYLSCSRPCQQGCTTMLVTGACGDTMICTCDTVGPIAGCCTVTVNSCGDVGTYGECYAFCGMEGSCDLVPYPSMMKAICGFGD